jgi:hypothetical protein
VGQNIPECLQSFRNTFGVVQSVDTQYEPSDIRGTPDVLGFRRNLGLHGEVRKFVEVNPDWTMAYNGPELFFKNQYS